VLSLGKMLEERRGFGPGFDFLRIFLALAVVGFHVLALSGHERLLRETPLWFGMTTGIPVFFALSGFLVGASGQRLSLSRFLMFRALRIVPALAVDVLICALILGPLFTTLPWREYFTDARFHSYFLNVFGWIHYKLPGVFEYYPNSKVNGALWTIPFELACYAFVAFLIVTRFIHSAWRVLPFVIVHFAVALVLDLTPIMDGWHWKVRFAAKLIFLGDSGRCIMAFMLGVLAWQLRYKIPISKALFAATSALGVIIILAGYDIGRSVPIEIVLLPGVVYWTMFVGLMPIPMPAFLRSGDYSYGVYLYHDPLIHVVNVSFPAVALGTAFGGWMTYALVFPAALGLAYLSWHFVEKPALGLRKKFAAGPRPGEESASANAAPASAVAAKP
jgi:peptidoglycan/LPS O-acetylase OafA/YrhL